MISIFANPEHLEHQAEGHPERPERVTAILEALDRADRGFNPEPAPIVEESVVHRLHDPGYVEMLDRAAASGGGYLDADTYITPQSMAAARTAAGSVVEGVHRVLAGTAQHAFSIVRPPGHHAEHGRAMGFCLLNNIGIGVIAARQRSVRRLAVLDFDVHHGNGTQHSFENDPEVFYASTHQYPFYPGTGSGGETGIDGNVINVPLAAGSGDRQFLGAWQKKIGPALDAFKPQLLLVSAGFDAHRDDPLAGLEVTTEGFGRLATLIKSWAAAHCQSRTVWVLEGGYNLRALADSALACLEVLLDESTDRGNPVDSVPDRGYNSGSPD